MGPGQPNLGQGSGAPPEQPRNVPPSQETQVPAGGCANEPAPHGTREGGNQPPVDRVVDHDNRCDPADLNAESGNAGNACGGGVENNAPTIQNHSVDSNVGGRGGYSRSGDSYARRSGARDRGGLARRAGRARTGTSGNVSGGAVVNNGQEVINAAGANTGGMGGQTASGHAIGCQAQTGNSGEASGGRIMNTGARSISNQSRANVGGVGGQTYSGVAHVRFRATE
ncbi:hypothetical protein NLI96_g4928 [Meripilus lineatus]|uniref:Uncharacterized protein n=1 Tax=Meripilus lineatus TaxID=2056292 RepID=A0AAD5V5W4_9APHY|nr:hypothetical protein NLI96_g4928 [Physisporinus lineatus]